MSQRQHDNTTDNIHIIEWQITNFSSCTLNEGERLESPISKADSLFDSCWSLLIYPKGKDGNSDFIGCYLKRMNTEKIGPAILHIENEFSLVAFDEVREFEKWASAEFSRNFCSGLTKYVKLENIYSRREFLLPCDTLTLRCKLRLLPPKEKQLSLHTFETNFPIKMVSEHLELSNFQSITKKYPRTLPIKGTKGLLSLKVSMNKDSEDQAKEGSVGSETSEFVHLFMKKIQSEKPIHVSCWVKSQDTKSKTDSQQAQMGSAGGKKTQTQETFLHIVMEKKKSEDPVHVSCWVKLLVTKSEIAVDKRVSHLFSKNDTDEEWILPYFIDTNNLWYDCMKNNTLFLDFDFTICDSQPKSFQTSALIPLKLDYPKATTLMEDLMGLYRTKIFYDATLNVENKLFMCHKSILAARSPVFEEIFTLLMKKRLDNVHVKLTAVISDVEDETMILLMKFIYTDVLEDLKDEKCLLLYSAAQKYKIPSLHFKCAELLIKNLSIKAVYKVLLIADEFGDSELIMSVLDFILDHYLYVLLSPEWAFTEEHDGMANRVMRYLRVKKQQQSEG